MPRREIPDIEVGQGTHIIEGVSTSIAGFIGLAKEGPVNEAVLVNDLYLP